MPDVDYPRQPFMNALNNMTDESFDYVVLACRLMIKDCINNHGFTPQSTESFNKLSIATESYIELRGKK